MTQSGEAPEHRSLSEGTGFFENGRSTETLPVTKTITALSLALLLLDMLGFISPKSTHLVMSHGELEGLWRLPFAWLCPTVGHLGFLGNLIVSGMLYGSLRRLELAFGSRWSVVFCALVGPLSLVGGVAMQRSLLGVAVAAGPEGIICAAVVAVALHQGGFTFPGETVHIEPKRLLAWFTVFLALVATVISVRAGLVGLIGIGLGYLLHNRDLEALYNRGATRFGHVTEALPETPADQGAVAHIWWWLSDLFFTSELGARWGALARSLSDALIARAPEAPKYWDEFEPNIDVKQIRKGRR